MLGIFDGFGDDSGGTAGGTEDSFSCSAQGMDFNPDTGLCIVGPPLPDASTPQQIPATFTPLPGSSGGRSSPSSSGSGFMTASTTGGGTDSTPLIVVGAVAVGLVALAWLTMGKKKAASSSYSPNRRRRRRVSRRRRARR